MYIYVNHMDMSLYVKTYMCYDQEGKKQGSRRTIVAARDLLTIQRPTGT